jgi:Fuc2NAc and GlcNAc transferase
MSLPTIIIILAAYLLTVIGVGYWRLLALRRQILDIPNERSSHTQPTPRSGGVVISFVTVVLLLMGAWLESRLLDILPFIGGAVLIAVVSWFDDLYSLPSVLRFGVHLLAALIAVFTVGHFSLIQFSFAQIDLAAFYLGHILTILWIVGLTNAYNFMDGIDGIAGAQGVTAGVGWTLIGLLINEPLVALFGGLLAATCLGFLWHNWHPAKIFMGDVSSAFLGYSFAMLPLLAIKYGTDDVQFPLIGLFLVWTFVFDAVLTFVRRALKGENVFAAHRSHLYQRLVITGFRHDAVTSIYAALSIFGVVAAILWLNHQDFLINLTVLGVILLCAALLWIFVRSVEARFGQKRTEEI